MYFRLRFVFANKKFLKPLSKTGFWVLKTLAFVCAFCEFIKSIFVNLVRF